MNKNDFVGPRVVPDRDAKYMGLAWMIASFSKDPKTQVGAVIVAENNFPLGSGYNGPPRRIKDDSFSWVRASNSNEFSKNDIIAHAEVNAIDHSDAVKLPGSTLYVTALPCPDCMLEIIRKDISRVVYMDFKTDPGSSLANADWRSKSFKKAEMANIKIEEFGGSVAWLEDWVICLKNRGVLSP